MENEQEKPNVSSPTYRALLCEVDGREKSQNVAFCRWVDNDVELKELSPKAKILLRDYVRGLNMSIADLESKIAMQST